MKHILILLLLCITCATIQAQIQEYGSFEFIYIDNSKPVSGDGLFEEQIKLIEKQIKNSAAKNSRFIMYISDADNPKVAQTIEEATALLGQISQKATEYPRDKVKDKKRIKDIIYNDQFEVTKKVNFYFFTTDFYFLSLSNEPSLLIGLLPAEISAAFENKEIPIEVTIYINNNEGDINIENMEENLNYSKKENYPNIKYKIIDL